MLLSIYAHITMLIIISIIGFFFFYRFEHYMPPPHNTINRAWHFSFFITHRGYLTMLKYFACYQFNLPMFCCRNFIVHNFLFMCALNFDLQNFLKNFCLHCARLIEQSCAVTFASCPITIVLTLWSVRCSTRFVLWPAGAYGPGQEIYSTISAITKIISCETSSLSITGIVSMEHFLPESIPESTVTGVHLAIYWNQYLWMLPIQTKGTENWRKSFHHLPS